MAEKDSLAALEGLHRDLCAYIDLQLPVVERLVLSLEAHLDDFKALLDKKPKSDASRQTLSSGRKHVTWFKQDADCGRQDHH